MDTFDRDGPPDGDFARYIERLSGTAGRAPGRVEARTGVAGRRAANAARNAGAQGAGTLAQTAAEALRRAGGARPGAAGAGKPPPSAFRALLLRASRTMAIVGIAFIVLTVLDILPWMTPLPGFALLVASVILRSLASR